jgi:hypothetical protein
MRRGKRGHELAYARGVYRRAHGTARMKLTI